MIIHDITRLIALLTFFAPPPGEVHLTLQKRSEKDSCIRYYFQ